MDKQQSMVKEFHDLFGVPCGTAPCIPDEKTCRLRISLIREELEEMEAAIEAGNIVEIADALADLQYVVAGAGLSFGIDLEPVFAEVHRSNMSKANPDGSITRREDGKVIKSPTYSRADIASVIARQVVA